MAQKPRRTDPVLSTFAILLFISLLSLPNSVIAMDTSPQVQSPQSPSQAYYIIFQRGPDGVIRPLSYAVVQLSTPLTSMDLENSAESMSAIHDRNCEPLEVRLQSKQGAILYRNEVCIPRWVRAEFHGADGGEIDGRILPQVNTTFVVRIPIHPEANLVLANTQSTPLATVSLDQLELEAPAIDLSGIATDVAVSPPPGDPANRVDLLVMGDGYTAAESALFDSEAATAIADFFAISPYGEYENYFNLHTLFIPSTQSGADHPPYDPFCPSFDLSCCLDIDMASDPLAGTFVNTAFDSSYCYYDIHRLLYVNLSAVYSAAAVVPDWDVIFILVNDGTYGGAGGSAMVASTHPLSAEIAQHEFGHTFVDLADEYDTAYPSYPACSDLSSPPCEANVTDVTTRAAIKWAPWIDPLTPIPTVPEWDPGFAGVVGLFEGARYLSTGMYRPGQDCIMRRLGKPYCQVPSQAFVLKLYNGGWGDSWDGISMIEPGSAVPVSSSIMLSHPASQAFHVDILEPQGGLPAQIAWFVDNVPVSGALSDTFLFTTDPGLPNPVEVRVYVTDATAFVHPDMAGSVLEFEHFWTVMVDYDLFLPLIMR